MKKFRILALVMTCAILLSSIMIPVAAETTDSTAPAGATLIYTVNFSGNDGIFSPSSPANDENKATFTPSSDGTTLTVGKSDPSYTSTSTTRDYWGGVFNGLTIDKNAVYTMIYKVKNPNTDKTSGNYAFSVGGVLADGKFDLKSGTSGSGSDVNAYIQYSNHYNLGRLGLGRTWSGPDNNITFNYELDETDGYVTTKLVYDFVNNQFSNYYLQNDGTWVEIQTGAMTNVSNAVLGFVLGINKPYYSDGTVIKDVKLYKGTADPATAATNVEGKTVTIDGVANANEGWSTTPLLTLGVYSNSGKDKNPETASTSWKTVDSTIAPKMKVSYDASNMYIYYETNDEGDASDDFSIARGGSSQRLYILLTPQDKVFKRNLSDAASANGDVFRLVVDMGVPADAPTDKPETYTWKGTVNTDYTADALVRRYGYTYGIHDGSGSGDAYFATSSDMYKNLELAMVYDPVNGTKTVEIKIPLGATYAQNLKDNEDSDVRLAVFERHSNNWSGYSTGAMEYDTAGTKPYGVNITIPRDVKMSDKTAITTNLVGFQSREGATEGTYDVRFVAVVDDAYEIDLATAKLGYLFGYNGKTSQQYCTKVYEELKAGEGTIKASTYGGKYFFCFTITGLSETESYTFDVKCFTKVASATYYEYCQNPVTVTITYEDGEAVFTTGQNG